MSQDIRDWTEASIVSFVNNRVVESATLEFKACDALGKNADKGWQREFAKDVCAFANSGGGILIYGIIENRDTHEAEKLDVGFDPAELNVEALEQIIRSRIQRKIEGIIVRAIPLSSTNDGRVLYVLDIPESGRAPHMANHRFYKRYNFISDYMEEHEVRERYRRETYPGKDVVEAWRDDAINPMIDSLGTESRCLMQGAWEWSHIYNVFKGFKKMAIASEFSANEDDFVSRHSVVRGLLQEHDALLLQMNEVGKVLFEKVSSSSFIQEVFTATTSEEALTALEKANPNTFRRTTASVMFGELFSHDRSPQDRFDMFAEWTINGTSPANAEPILTFWRTNHERFREIVIYPPLSEYRTKVEQARTTLLEFNQNFVAKLKEIRKTLSEHHNIRVESSGQPYDSGLAWGPRHRFY